MHNEGYGLDGNTEESDIRWFARLLYEKGGYVSRFESAEHDHQSREAARRVRADEVAAGKSGLRGRLYE